MSGNLKKPCRETNNFKGVRESKEMKDVRELKETMQGDQQG